MNEFDKIKEKMESYDEMIENAIQMFEPNTSIIIFQGEFVMACNEVTIILNGDIKYDWFPNSGAIFFGEVLNESIDLVKLQKDEVFTIKINGVDFGKVLITNISLKNGTFISGTLAQEAVLGDTSVPVEKILFSIPNLRKFSGEIIKKTSENNIKTGDYRLRFENEKYKIVIDRKQNYDELKKKLDQKGGYITLYDGELISKKGAITFEESKDIFYCLDTFITFLNGRRTSAIFMQGSFDNEVIWTDYTDYHVDLYNFVPSWPEVHSIKGLNELFQNFSTIWKDQNNRQFITSAIHWYIEANSNNGFSEGAIIMAQTALELLYNWFIVEKKKMIIGKDSENINASNKIRLLLSQLNINYSVPEKFDMLQLFIDQNKQILDAPDAVVQIRNAIVHSQEEKRKKLSEIHYKTKYQALQLCIWYIEMSLLAVFDYKGKYCNRCSLEKFTSKTVENLPWIKVLNY